MSYSDYFSKHFEGLNEDQRREVVEDLQSEAEFWQQQAATGQLIQMASQHARKLDSLQGTQFRTQSLNALDQAFLAAEQRGWNSVMGE